MKCSFLKGWQIFFRDLNGRKHCKVGYIFSKTTSFSVHFNRKRAVFGPFLRAEAMKTMIKFTHFHHSKSSPDILFRKKRLFPLKNSRKSIVFSLKSPRHSLK